MNKMNQKKKIANKLILYIPLIIMFVISIFPFYWMFMGGTNFSSKMFTNPPTLSLGDQFMTNLNNLNETVGIWRVLFNSLFVSLMYVLLSLTVCTLAAYPLSKFQFKGRDVIFLVFMLSMMIRSEERRVGKECRYRRSP